MATNVRKIGRIGYTRTLSLPLFWLRSVGLDAGDSLEVSLSKNNELLVRPYKGDISDKKNKKTLEKRS